MLTQWDNPEGMVALSHFTREEQVEQVETVSAKLAVRLWKLRNKEKSKFNRI
jgi:hypothetical protein